MRRRFLFHHVTVRGDIREDIGIRMNADELRWLLIFIKEHSLPSISSGMRRIAFLSASKRDKEVVEKDFRGCLMRVKNAECLSSLPEAFRFALREVAKKED